MKILAVLVNYGKEQVGYLHTIIESLQDLYDYDVDIVVNSNIPLSIPGISVNVFRLSNYQYLPLTCRKTIWENQNDYDIFIYSENDHLIEDHHVSNFLKYTSILPENRIAGLMQFERNEQGDLFYPAYHGEYDWDINSVEEYEGIKFAHFTNLHQGSFILTREQLLRIGRMHDFTKPIGSSKYSIKCRVNTDIYQFCGMKKVICISDFYANIIHHLPNIYIYGDKGRNQLGSWDAKMKTKLNQLLQCTE